MSDAEMVRLFHDGLSCSEIAQRAGRTMAYVHHVIVGSWTACEEAPKRDGRRVIPDETVRRIKASKDRMGVTEAARAYGVSPVAVRRIWSGKTYKEV